MVKLLWGPVLILLRTALQMIQPFQKGSIEKLLLLKNRSPNQGNVCKFPRIALVRFSRGLYASAQSRNQLQRIGFVHLVQIRNDYIEIE